MKKSTTTRREWVKNTALIFLAVLWILTFFSNTFLNYSLPEVDTTYVQSGSITAKVRGTGNVEASDPYSVIAKESRVITSVAVEQGDVVEKDDVLYYLEESESEELKTAEAELDALVLEYMLSLFSGEASNSTINKVENDNVDSFGSMQAQIAAMQNSVRAAEDNVAASQDNLDNLTRQSDLLANDKPLDTAAQQEAVDDAQESLNNAQSQVTNIATKLSNLERQKSEAEAKIAAAEALVPDIDDLNNPSGGIQLLQDKEENASAALTAEGTYVITQINGILDTYVSSGYSPDLNLEETINELKNKGVLSTLLGNDEITEAEFIASSEAYATYLAAYEAKKAAYDVAKKNREEGTKTLQNYASYLSQLASLENQIASARNEQTKAASNVTKAQNTLTSAQQVLNDLKNDTGTSTAQWDIANRIIEAEAALADANSNLEKIQKEQTELITNIQAELNLDSKNDQIAEKEAEIEKLKEQSAGSAVTSPVAGTVTSLAHVAGETMKLDEEIAVIQVAGKGFTLSLSVTNEEAAKVAVGDTAELDNAWYYNDTQIILTSIRPDPDNPGRNRLLVFAVDGENIQNGQALSVSVGQRSSDYELVVPKSAIREDQNGKFILIIDERGTPLGTRYIATRVDVEELASDDNNMAISGALYGYGEYVITTATKPVSAGQQVRLPD